jgi:hypothetical protein
MDDILSVIQESNIKGVYSYIRLYFIYLDLRAVNYLYSAFNPLKDTHYFVLVFP